MDSDLKDFLLDDSGGEKEEQEKEEDACSTTSSLPLGVEAANYVANNDHKRSPKSKAVPPVSPTTANRVRCEGFILVTSPQMAICFSTDSSFPNNHLITLTHNQ